MDTDHEVNSFSGLLREFWDDMRVPFLGHSALWLLVLWHLYGVVALPLAVLGGLISTLLGYPICNFQSGCLYEIWGLFCSGGLIFLFLLSQGAFLKRSQQHPPPAQLPGAVRVVQREP